ncbi:hypothetical protein ACEY2E_00550 [Metamycoplasma salivarium]|uniref:hypothetical protein n=1 Tax=Metamycoplasma salivarium TaxID=2124 RepID=UPI0035BC8DEE
MNKYAANEIIKYQNPNNGMDPINLYYVKEVKFDFSQNEAPQSYALQLGANNFSTILNEPYQMFLKVRVLKMNI